MDPKQTKVITAHVPLPLSQKIDAMAEQMERSRGWIIKQALMQWVETEEWRHQQTLDALAQAKAGKVVPHQEVKDWMASFRKSLTKN